MKNLILIGLFSFSGWVLAHEGGHGPQVTDTGKYGGLVSAVVLKAEAAKAEKATMIYKSELVRSSDGTTRLYLYDQSMKPLDLAPFAAKASASLGVKVKGKWNESPFEFEKKDNAYIGKMPKPVGKPYNIDVTFQQGEKVLLSAFDNLD